MTIAARTIPGLRSPARDRVRLLGMGIDRLDYAGVEGRMAEMVAAGGHHQAVTVNLDFLAVGSRSPAFRTLVNDAALVVPDGTPVLWGARYLGAPLYGRITGPDLIEMAVRHSQAHGSSLFFLGAAPGVAGTAADRLAETHGAFNLAGVYSPPFGPLDGDEDKRIRGIITGARPDFLFVAFGCPKQDFWIRAHADMGVPFCAGIGGSFEFFSGKIARAPRWAQTSGLEWAFRLYHEPRRLARRYLVDDMQVLGKLVLSRFSRAYEAPSPGAD